MSEQDVLYRMWRLVQYKRLRAPSLEEVLAGIEYEYASSIINHVPTWKYGKWDSAWGLVHKEHLEQALQDSNIRTLVPLPTKYLLELLQDYPLEFEYNGMNIIVTPSGNRTVYVNGHDQIKLPDSLAKKWFTDFESDFHKDWKYLLLGHHEQIQTEPKDILYKYFKGICTNVTERVNKLKEIQNLIKSNMTTKELRDLLIEKPLNFEVNGLDIVVLPFDKYKTNKVYINGREQYSIGWFEELHDRWFKPTKNLSKEELAFQQDWRCALSLNNGGKEPQSWLNVVPKYYKGVVEDVEKHIEVQLAKPRASKVVAIIRKLLSEKAKYGKNSKENQKDDN